MTEITLRPLCVRESISCDPKSHSLSLFFSLIYKLVEWTTPFLTDMPPLGRTLLLVQIENLENCSLSVILKVSFR